MTRRNWNRLQPTSLRHALELCKDFAKEKNNLSVERIAQLSGLTDHWTLYKWIQTGKIPANMIAPFEAVCGVNYVTRWLAISSNKLLIEIPVGRKADAMEMNTLQLCAHEAIGLLLKFYGGESTADDTLAAIQQVMRGLAWHKGNVEKHQQPELGFEGNE